MPFISVEGGEGCGKSTQLRLLGRALQEQAIPHVMTREPGGEPGAEAIRELVVQGEADRWEGMAETLLFLAARYQHVVRVIMPAIEAGKWVVCDRFHDSTRVYQGIGKEISDASYMALHQEIFGDKMVPDLTILLDLPPEVGLRRTLSRTHDETRFESMDISFHEKVRAGFLALAEQEPERIRVIDASGTVDQTHQAIIETLNINPGVFLNPITL